MSCKFLDYRRSQYPTCSLEQCADGTLFWLREAPYPGAPTAVQFCKKRGRLNHILACTCADYAMCSDYKEENDDE